MQRRSNAPYLRDAVLRARADVTWTNFEPCAPSGLQDTTESGDTECFFTRRSRKACWGQQPSSLNSRSRPAESAYEECLDTNSGFSRWSAETGCAALSYRGILLDCGYAWISLSSSGCRRTQVRSRGSSDPRGAIADASPMEPKEGGLLLNFNAPVQGWDRQHDPMNYDGSLSAQCPVVDSLAICLTYSCASLSYRISATST